MGVLGSKGFYSLIAIAFTLVSFFQNIGYGQDFSKTRSARFGVKFKAPKEFRMFNNDDEPFREYFFYTTKPDDRRRNILPDFYLVNKDSSILILAETYGYSPMEPDIFNRYWIDPNRLAFNHALGSSDTTDRSIEYYSAGRRRYSRADWIAEFTRDLGSRNTFGDYLYNRCLVINKHDQVFLQVTYLFKESARDKVDKVLHTTRRMFRFEDRPAAAPASIARNLEKHYVEVDADILEDSLVHRWNEGKIYDNQYHFWGEDLAFERDGMVISVKFPTNDKWPYMNHIYQERMDTASNRVRWDVANKDHHRFLALARFTPYQCTVSETSELNADEAYIFDFSHDRDDLYRGTYQDCKVIVFHKRNVGSVIVKYYYRSRDGEKVDRLMESTWGKIRFRGRAFFDGLEGRFYPY